MRKLSFLCALVCLFAVCAFAQSGVRYGDGQQISSATVSGGPLFSVPSPIINFCNYPANAVPCTNKVTTYTDITLGTSCPTSTQLVLAGTSNCVGRGDLFGNWGVWVPSGTYSYTITLASGASLGPYIVTLATGGGIGGSIASGQVAFGSGTNTIQGTNNATLDSSGDLTLAGILSAPGIRLVGVGQAVYTGVSGSTCPNPGVGIGVQFCLFGPDGVGQFWNGTQNLDTPLVSGSVTVGHCGEWASASPPTLEDAGAACGTGSGLSFPLTVSGTTTSGGIPYFSSTTALSSSALLAANHVLLGGGAGSAPTSDSKLDDGATSANTLTYTGTGGITATGGPLTAASDGVHAGMVNLVGNTANPSIPANEFGWLGFTTTSQAALFFQPATTNPSNSVMLFPAPTSNVSQYSWKGLAGSGAGLVTGPTSSTNGDLVGYTGTGGQTADSGIPGSFAANSVLMNPTASSATPTPTSLPTCTGTSSADVYDTTLHSWVCNSTTGVNPSVIFALPSCGGAANCAFIYDDGQIRTDCSVTANTNPVTCPDGNFVSGDVGKVFFATQNTVIGYATGNLICSATTISAVNSATSINVTTPTDCGSSVVGSLVIWWGHDDTSNLAAAWTLVQNSCGSLQLPGANAQLTGPAAIYTTTGQFNTQAALCADLGAGQQDFSEVIAGYGPQVTKIILSPSFSYSTSTSCQGAGTGSGFTFAGNSCFMGVANVSWMMRDMAIAGLGQSSDCPSSATVMLGQAFYTSVDNVWLTGFGNTCANLTAVLNSGAWEPSTRIVDDSLGGTGIECYLPTGITQPCILRQDSFQNQDVSGGNGSLYVPNVGYVLDTDSSWGPTAGSNSINVRSGGQYYGTHITPLGFTGAGGSSVRFVYCAGFCSFTDSQFITSLNIDVVTLDNFGAAPGKLLLRNTTIEAGASGEAVQVANGNSGAPFPVVQNLGGNHVTSYTSTGSPVYLSQPNESVAGTCSSNAASITLGGFYVVAPIVTISPTTSASTGDQVTSVSVTSNVATATVHCNGTTDSFVLTATPNPF